MKADAHLDALRAGARGILAAAARQAIEGAAGTMPLACLPRGECGGSWAFGPAGGCTHRRPAPGAAAELAPDAAAELAPDAGGVAAVGVKAADGAPLGCLDFARAAEALELAAFEAAQALSRAQPRQRLGEVYPDFVRAARAALALQAGLFPDDVLGWRLLRGEAPASRLVEAGLALPGPPGHREVIRRRLARALLAADPAFGARDYAEATVRALESSCYGAAVAESKRSEEPPRRQWSAPEFVDLYSARCGRVLALIDPGTASCRAYGPQLVPRLLDGSLCPRAVGALTEKELCPPAFAAESAEIRQRLAQKVVHKASNLFQCPFCKARNSTYREAQNRSLDEAPDYDCSCLSCGKRFRGRQ